MADGATPTTASDADGDGDEFATIDVEDLSILSEMVSLGTAYIQEQDEAADHANIPVMQDALKNITSLIPYEMGEDERGEASD